MRFCYSPPTGIEVTITGSAAGAAFINDDAGAALLNMRPGLGARVQWISGAQTTASYVEIRFAWPTAIVLRSLAVLGITLPAGTRIELLGRLDGDPDFDTDLGAAADGRVYQRARGERVCVFWLADQAALLDGVAVRIYNDVDGSADIPADLVFDLAEVLLGEGHELPIMRGWELRPMDTDVKNQGHTGQRFTVVGARYWELSATPLFRRQTVFYGTEDAGPEGSYLRLLARIDRGQPVLVIPRHSTDDLQQESSIFGTVEEIGPIKHRGGPYYQPEPLRIREIPVPV